MTTITRKTRLSLAERLISLCLLIAASLSANSCAPKAGDLAYTRAGDEIMVCGQLFHTGAPVVLWSDPGGYDAYRTEKRFGPLDKASWEASTGKAGAGGAGGPESPARYNTRFFRFVETQPDFVGAPPPWADPGRVGPPSPPGLRPDEITRVRGGAWDLPTLQRVVDQFVLHFDVCGTSRQCFRILQDVRGLSVHFMLDIDGTIYQTLDLKERAWHATSSNDRSIGIEIANIGAYGPGEKDPFDRWYRREFLSPGNPGTVGNPSRVQLLIPQDMGDGGIRTPGFVGYSARSSMVLGHVQGKQMRQYDFTPEQYASLTRLTEALSRIFPNMPRDYPRDAQGKLITGKLSDEQLRNYRGILGHYHIQDNKTDPGPALQWDAVIGRSSLIKD